MLDACTPHHDLFNTVLTFGLCCGLVISYLPQHYRIISTKSSEGLSPVFLLLGTTSAASGMFNMITLQTPIVKCCRVVSLGSCLEMSAGVIQVGLQWLCFGLVFVLYMLYYPEHLKYIEIDLEEGDELPPILLKTPVRTEGWRLSIILAWITVVHFFFLFFVTAYLLYTVPNSPTPTLPPQISLWATFSGVSAAALAAVQYMPQLMHTYRMKLVGALSIPMMMIQTPGGILMVISIVLRPGTNWTSWITFAIAAILQGCLLIMCIVWKIRQNKLAIDDFGNPLNGSTSDSYSDVNSNAGTYNRTLEDDNSVSGLVRIASDNRVVVRALPAHGVNGHTVSSLDEQTPLLGRASNASTKSPDTKGWQAWFKR